MSKLSTEKLNKYKRNNGYTNKKISEIACIPIATVDRLFSGANSNPNISLLQKIAQLFECTVDDFIEYDTNSVVDKCYKDKEIIKLAHELQTNQIYREIITNIKSFDSDDTGRLSTIINLVRELAHK